MPLKRGTSERVVSHNIGEMRAAGHPEAQAVAAAMHQKDKSSHRKYGDADMKDEEKKKGAPALAVMIHGEPEDDGPEGGDIEKADEDEDEGDHEAAMRAAGDAAIKAFHAGDGLGFMKAMAAGMSAHSAGADSEEGEGEDGDNPLFSDAELTERSEEFDPDGEDGERTSKESRSQQYRGLTKKKRETYMDRDDPERGFNQFSDADLDSDDEDGDHMYAPPPRTSLRGVELGERDFADADLDSDISGGANRTGMYNPPRRSFKGPGTRTVKYADADLDSDVTGGSNRTGMYRPPSRRGIAGQNSGQGMTAGRRFMR